MAGGVLGAGALVAALALSGGSGAGAQPGPAAPVPVAASSPAGGVATAAESAAGSSKDETGVRAPVEKSPKKVKIRERGPGTFTRADVDGPKVGDPDARLLRYAVKVEKGLPYDADQTARAIEETLSDPRSWIGGGEWRLELVSDPARASFTIFLATPGTVDRYCWPLRTYGRVSCQAGNRVMLNAWRWAHGADAYGSDVGAYREYLVNHEVGHRLGHNHVGCPGKGKRAPVMMQQTKDVGACEANPWPAPKRRS
ncbi:MAG TPA: DUF3152 domain-containing protein [Microlunatus sp.]